MQVAVASVPSASGATVPFEPMSSIQFDQALHEAGERVSVQSLTLVRALAWTVASDLVRRHPTDLRVIETHPGGGQYDCLSVVRWSADRSELENIVHLNVLGHITPNSWFGSVDDERFNWLEVLLCADRRCYVVTQLERTAGLQVPAHAPMPTSTSIGPMVISAFLGRSALGAAGWKAANGVCDSSQDVSVRRHLFEQLSWVGDAAADTAPGAPFERPEYRFWFLGSKDDEGVDLSSAAFAVDSWTGELWRHDGLHVDLLRQYRRANNSLDALVSAVCPPAY